MLFKYNAIFYLKVLSLVLDYGDYMVSGHVNLCKDNKKYFIMFFIAQTHLIFLFYFYCLVIGVLPANMNHILFEMFPLWNSFYS